MHVITLLLSLLAFPDLHDKFPFRFSPRYFPLIVPAHFLLQRCFSTIPARFISDGPVLLLQFTPAGCNIVSLIAPASSCFFDGRTLASTLPPSRVACSF